MVIPLFAPPAAVVAGSDVFSWISATSGNAKTAVVAVGGVLAVAFVLIGAWRVRGALAGVVSALIAGLFFYWALSHVSDSGVQQKISQTVKNGSGPVTTAPYDPSVKV